jgi:o-succinylbenzoate synthase
MRIVRARCIPYRLPLKRPWVAAAATLRERQGMLVAVETDAGLVGHGDCAPLPSSGAAGHARVFAALRAVAESLPGQDIAAVALPATAPPELRWALETALVDILAQRQGVSMAGYLGLQPRQKLGAGGTVDCVSVNAAIGALNADCIERVATAREQGYRFAKIKVGVGAPDAELARLRELHAAAPGLRLRLDANRAWRDADALRFLTGIADLPIDAVEEPLAAPTVERLAALQRALPFAVAVDESLAELGAEALFAAGAVRRLVLKPARVGGIAATCALVVRARAAGVETVLTSVVDSAVGVTAAAHLAAALAPGIAHGLATLDWLAADVAAGPPLVGGALTLAAAPGLGLRLHDEFA